VVCVCVCVFVEGMGKLHGVVVDLRRMNNERTTNNINGKWRVWRGEVISHDLMSQGPWTATRQLWRCGGAGINNN